MPLQPSIVVTSQDSYKLWLLASVQGSAADVAAEENELKAYMAGQKCPTGMLVTPERARFYRNNYTDHTPQSVELIAGCPTIDLLEAPEKVVEPYLVYFVQEWLESLAGGARRPWPPAVREAIDFDVIPTIRGGYVGASGPRWLRTA
jgi:hypothetical protein